MNFLDKHEASYLCIFRDVVEEFDPVRLICRLGHTTCVGCGEMDIDPTYTHYLRLDELVAAYHAQHTQPAVAPAPAVAPPTALTQLSFAWG